jgi:hypothetical protein
MAAMMQLPKEADHFLNALFFRLQFSW